MDSSTLKERVREHWEAETCGARYGDRSADRRTFFDQIERSRYEQDYMLRDFARFETSTGKYVLEVGLGTGTDFVQWCRAGAHAFGIDLTDASVRYVRERLDLYGLEGSVGQGDAESLPFPDDRFDIYFSWGVLHHTPDTERAIAEAYRVLKPGGELRIMLYHHTSVSTFLVWLLYGPLRGRRLTAREAVAQNVESPGTRVFTREEAASMVARHFPADRLRIATYLGSGDLLSQRPSTKYRSTLWRLLFRVYPRRAVRLLLGHRFGTVMTISAWK